MKAFFASQELKAHALIGFIVVVDYVLVLI